MEIKFSYTTDEGTSIEFKSSSVGLSDLCDDFKRFLMAVGYMIPATADIIVVEDHEEVIEIKEHQELEERIEKLELEKEQ